MDTLHRVRLPRRDLAWMYALAAAFVCALLAALVAPADPAMVSGGFAGWLFASVLAVGLRLRGPASADLVLDGVRRRVTVDGAATELRRGVSVEVVPHPVLARSNVLVHDAAGRELWRISGLHPSHARCLALELAARFRLFASPAIERIPRGQDAVGPAAEITPGVHEVRVSVWSRPLQLGALGGAFVSLVPMFGLAPQPGVDPVLAPLVGPLLVGATLLLGCVLVGITPVRMQLAIGAEHLIVRTGSLLLREERVRIADLHPPRIVGDDREVVSLVLSGNDGFLAEIRGRPREELQRIAGWIALARAGAAPAVPASEGAPELPEALERLRERIEVPIRRERRSFEA